MPNLASGRAASRLDLRGPNFVVDAGARSVDAILDAAALLVGDSARVVLATAVCASRHAAPRLREAVVCLAVTTPDLAAELRLPVLARLRRDAEVARAPQPARADATMPCGAAGGEELLLAVDAAVRGRATSVASAGGATWTVSPAAVVTDAVEPAVTMHQPVWVTVPPAAAPAAPYAAAIIVAPADPKLASELLGAAPRLVRAVRIAVPAGVSSSDPCVIAIDVADERSAEVGLALLDEFATEAIIVVDHAPLDSSARPPRRSPDIDGERDCAAVPRLVASPVQLPSGTSSVPAHESQIWSAGCARSCGRSMPVRSRCSPGRRRSARCSRPRALSRCGHTHSRRWIWHRGACRARRAARTPGDRQFADLIANGEPAWTVTAHMVFADWAGHVEPAIWAWRADSHVSRSELARDSRLLAVHALRLLVASRATRPGDLALAMADDSTASVVTCITLLAAQDQPALVHELLDLVAAAATIARLRAFAVGAYAARWFGSAPVADVLHAVRVALGGTTSDPALAWILAISTDRACVSPPDRRGASDASE